MLSERFYAFFIFPTYKKGFFISWKCWLNQQVKGFKKSTCKFKEEWSLSDQSVLCRRVLILGKNWEKIAEGIVGYDANSCKNEWERINLKNSYSGFHLISSTRMKFWTPDEVSRLKESVNKYILNKPADEPVMDKASLWNKISSYVGRSSIQCYIKWERLLKQKTVKGPWTDSEKQIIEDARKKYGNHWKKISTLVPGRTSEQIEIYFRENRRNYLKNNLRYSPNILDRIDQYLSTGSYHMSNGKISWTKLSKDHFPTIRPIQLRKAWMRNNITGFKKNKWSLEETEKLVKAVNYVRSANISYQIWRAVATLVPGRTPESCKTKYRYLRFQKPPSSPSRNWTMVDHLRLIDKAVERRFRWVDVAVDLSQPETVCRSKFHDLLVTRGTLSGDLARQAWIEKGN